MGPGAPIAAKGLSALTGPLISGGTSILGSLFGGLFTGSQNRASQRFAREMYGLQRQHALEDFRRVNDYNHPSNVMKRLQAAGINPITAFGKGSASGGVASPIRNPDVQSAQFRTPDMTGLNTAGTRFMDQYYNMEIRQAQHDNLKADNTVKLQEALLKASETLKNNSETDRNIFDLDFEKELRSVSADHRREILRQLKNQIDIDMDENERRWALSGMSLKESAEKILNYRIGRAQTWQEIRRLKEQRKNLMANTDLQKLEYKLLQQGFSRNDGIFARIIGSQLTNDKSLWQLLKDTFVDPSGSQSKNFWRIVGKLGSGSSRR